MNDWQRVTKAFRCPVCGKPDWCMIGDHYFLCMRVQSDKPCKSGGWFHCIEEPRRAYVPPPRPERPKIDADGMMTEWGASTPMFYLQSFASNLGVTFDSLCELECSWARPHLAWAFPMKNGLGKCVGIRLRAENGKKWAVTGSHQGIFIPRCSPQRRAYLPEGPTDTAAARSLGFFAVGRPSCQCGVLELRQWLKRVGVCEVVVIADNDDPGLNGARRLASELPFRSCVYLPPAKDLREFVKLGGTRTMIESTVNGMIWHQPKE